MTNIYPITDNDFITCLGPTWDMPRDTEDLARALYKINRLMNAYAVPPPPAAVVVPLDDCNDGDPPGLISFDNE